MKTTLTVEFDEIELKDLKRMVKANDMANVLFEIQFNLKKRMVQDDKNDIDTIERIFNAISELYQENYIDMDELIN